MQMAFFMSYLPVRMYLVVISDDNDIKPSKRNIYACKVFIKYLYIFFTELTNLTFTYLQIKTKYLLGT